MKSVRISDEAYAKIARKARKDKRTIAATIDILIDEVQESRKAAPNTPPYPPVDWGSESDPEVEHSASKPIRRAETKDMTHDEMMQISQRIRNKAYRDQEMGDEE